MIEQVFHIGGMYCPNCAMKLESLEDELPGVKQISASYKKEQMIVIYDPSRIGADEIMAAVTKKGYQAEAIS